MLNKIRDCVERKMGAGYRVSCKEITKNNGIKKCGISIMKANSEIAPIIYVDEFMEDDICDKTRVQIAADYVVDTYKHYERGSATNVIGSLINDKQSILDRVIYRLVNTKRNSNKLLEIPHIDFLDLSAEYAVVLNTTGNIMSFSVNRQMCNRLEITEGELDKAARRNTEKSFRRQTLDEIVSEILGVAVSPDAVMPNMYVYTRKDRRFGASVMLYPQEFGDLAEKISDDLFILPSSVHDVIAVPAHNLSKDQLREMVGTVNVLEVADDEVLSDNVYRYSLKTGQIVIA